jgi:hypothetical protein
LTEAEHGSLEQVEAASTVEGGAGEVGSYAGDRARRAAETERAGSRRWCREEAWAEEVEGAQESLVSGVAGSMQKQDDVMADGEERREAERAAAAAVAAKQARQREDAW